MPIAILSVYDKTGLADLARGLRDLGWTFLASSGTARWLRDGGIESTDVAEYTGLRPLLNGRVKTTHPAIQAGLLARDTETDRLDMQAQDWKYIDLAVVNLYPFEDVITRPAVSMEKALENIDIGGVNLIRSAAKNYGRVTLLCDPGDYPAVLAELQRSGVSPEMRQRLAVKGFALTARYDAAIASYLGIHALSGRPAASGLQPLDIRLYPVQKLRYGENPHQSATLYSYQPGVGPLGGKILQGKELSYTNLLDLDGAWRVVTSFGRPTVCIMRQVSPCGIASGESLAGAFLAALATDPVSAHGSVVAGNRVVDAELVTALGDVFVECIIAPGFTEDARSLLAERRNCRVIEMPDMVLEPKFELRSIAQGVLKQDVDFGDPAGGAAWRVVSKRQPTEDEWTALRFAWKSCFFVRSNAIVLARGLSTVGIGGGQPNRVDCVRVALLRAGNRAKGAVMASDAFFQFPDAIEVAAQAGITAVVHPGGSVGDQDAIEAANQAGMAMLWSGVRHFRH